MLCDGLSSQDGFRWLTAPQRDGRRSAIDAASASVSGDGRYVAFTSYARLTAADVDSLADIYVLDRSTATVTLESAAADGRALKSDCSHPRISADGRYVAFEAITSDDPERSETEVVLRDRVENTARWIAIAPGGVSLNGWSGQPDVAASGAAIVFASAATNLVPDDLNGSLADVYRFDLASNRIERISVDSRGAQQQGASQMPSVSGDGRYVAFASTAVLGRPRQGREQTLNRQPFPTIYLRDTRTGRTIPIGGAAGLPDDASTMPVVSADGRFVAFASRATNLVARDRNKSSDVFLYDVETGVTDACQPRRRRRPRQRREPDARDLRGWPVRRVPVRRVRHGLRTGLPAGVGGHQPAPGRLHLRSGHRSDLAGEPRPSGPVDGGERRPGDRW